MISIIALVALICIIDIIFKLGLTKNMYLFTFMLAGTVIAILSIVWISIMNRQHKTETAPLQPAVVIPEEKVMTLSDVEYCIRKEGYIPVRKENSVCFKISGEEICLGARIIAVADSFDAMISNRTYRRGLGFEKTMEELQKIGFRIAIDDFGTGYSSLNVLLEIPADVIKMDKSFTDKLQIEKQRRFVAKMGMLIKAARQEIIVFEECQNAQIQHHHGNHDCFFLTFNPVFVFFFLVLIPVCLVCLQLRLGILRDLVDPQCR